VTVCSFSASATCYVELNGRLRPRAIIRKLFWDTGYAFWISKSMRKRRSCTVALWSIWCFVIPSPYATGMNKLVCPNSQDADLWSPGTIDHAEPTVVGQATERITRLDSNDQRSRKLKDEFELPVAPMHRRDGVLLGGNKIDRLKQDGVTLAIAEHRQAVPSDVLSTNNPESAFAKFEAAFAEAKVPDCLRKDGLKRQPPRIGFFVFQGVLAFPFVALAKIRGKCL
jgi:hypothetical protein